MDHIYAKILIQIKENINSPVISGNCLQKVLLGIAWASSWQGRKENQE